MRQYGETGRRRLRRGRRVRKERLGVCRAGQADTDVKEGEGVSKTRGGVERGGRCSSRRYAGIRIRKFKALEMSAITHMCCANCDTDPKFNAKRLKSGETSVQPK